MSFNNGHDRWNTEEEKAFLDGIGKRKFGLKDSISVRKSRRELLANYIEIAKKRNDWDVLDGQAIIKYAKELLKKETICQNKS